MAFTSVLTTPTELRSRSDGARSPVWEKKIVYTINAGDGSTKTSQAVEVNGLLKKITAKSSAAAGITGTFTLSIEDSNDDEMFTASGPAEGAVDKWSVDEPLSGVVDVYIDPNDDPTTGSWTITVTLRGV